MESTINSRLSLPQRIAAAGTAVIALALMLTGTAGADGHRERRHDAGEPYRARHWIYDDRYHHGHYYPSIGYSVAPGPGRSAASALAMSSHLCRSSRSARLE
jgi:hypothetical protein